MVWKISVTLAAKDPNNKMSACSFPIWHIWHVNYILMILRRSASLPTHVTRLLAEDMVPRWCFCTGMKRWPLATFDNHTAFSAQLLVGPVGMAFSPKNLRRTIPIPAHNTSAHQEHGQAFSSRRMEEERLLSLPLRKWNILQNTRIDEAVSKFPPKEMPGTRKCLAFGVYLSRWKHKKYS